MKIYIAGPDVFYPNANELAENAHQQCNARGHKALCPVDNNIPKGGNTSLQIYDANVAMIEEADAVVANLTPFRGPSADPGTVWEVGFAHGLGKPVVGYTTDPRKYRDKVTPDGYMVEDFGDFDNLMIVHTLKGLYDTFEEALDYFK